MLFKLLLTLLLGYLFYLVLKAVLFSRQVYGAHKWQQQAAQGFTQKPHEKDISSVAKIIEEKPLDKE